MSQFNYHDPKVRDRTVKELSVRKKEFLIICDVLDILGVNYFLNTGILLGAVRNNDFIKWDWDIEISVFTDELLPKIDLISNEIKKKGFKITKFIKDENNLKIDFIGAYPKDVTSYTIYGWKYSKLRGVFWRRQLSIPSKYLKKLSKINFLGRQFNCPHPCEDYLSFVYGDWKKPLRDSNKKIYHSKNFYKKTFSFIIYLEKYLMKINSYIILIKKFIKL